MLLMKDKIIKIVSIICLFIAYGLLIYGGLTHPIIAGSILIIASVCIYAIEVYLQALPGKAMYDQAIKDMDDMRAELEYLRMMTPQGTDAFAELRKKRGLSS